MSWQSRQRRLPASARLLPWPLLSPMLKKMVGISLLESLLCPVELTPEQRFRGMCSDRRCWKDQYRCMLRQLSMAASISSASAL